MYVGSPKQECLNGFLNDEVRPTFFGRIEQDEDRGYEVDQVNQ